MTEETKLKDVEKPASVSGDEEKKASMSKKRRTIKGNLTYTATPGKTRDVLNALIPAERPAKFSQNFLNDVLEQKGGSANQQIPVLKSLGLLDSGGVPTELYSAFQSEGQRSAAAIQALKNGYAELFRKNSHIHQASDDRIKDAIVGATGLAKNDRVVGYIKSTFNTIKEFVSDPTATLDGVVEKEGNADEPPQEVSLNSGFQTGNLGLQYNINLVLPQANNIEVYDLIFKSLRENILDWSR